MLCHASILFLLVAQALAEPAYVDCTGKTVQDDFDSCLAKFLSPANIKDCALFVKRAACINPSCCGNELYTSLISGYNTTLANTYKITNCNIPCAGGATPPADTLDCNSMATSDIMYREYEKLGPNNALSKDTACKFYQGYASLIPKTCCPNNFYINTMEYMKAQLASLKIDGCQLVCGQSLSSAPSAPRAVFTVMALSAVIASAMVIY
jgi:hypothetical protein